MKKIILAMFTILLTSCQPNTQSSLPVNPAQERAIVTRVVDGDTIVILLNGKMEYVRIIGIDAPEKDECFSDQATEKIRGLVEGKRVTLESKIDENRDKYDRLLRYLSVDGIDVGGQMLYSGFARNYPWFPHFRSGMYNEIEKQAQESRLGLWGECD